MTFKLEIEMENAAFERSPRSELARILNNVAEQLKTFSNVNAIAGRCMDINGNTVGRFEVEE